jgi:GntR family transcriptional regulator
MCSLFGERDAMALFEVDESSGLPVWVQLRNRFVYLISTGHYQPGDQLPSVRRLAAETSINYNTVSKVYVNLERDGYVISVRGKGVFVRDIGEKKRDDASSVAEAIIEDSIKRCMMMGMSLDEVKLRMLDVAQRIQQESRNLSNEKKALYERKNAKKAE